MKNSKNNRYKFTFGKQELTLTTDKDNLFMEEINRIATEKYQALKERTPNASDEVLALLLAVNSLTTQLSREVEHEKVEKELQELREKYQELVGNSEVVDD